jgi:hypothetical protein
MSTIAEVEQALTALLLAGKELGQASVRVGDLGSAAVRPAELKASLAHRHAREVVEAFASRSYEAGLDLGRRSALTGKP